MALPPEAVTALQDLTTTPGVVGALIFDATGKVQASAFPKIFLPEQLAQLAKQLGLDSFFQQWVGAPRAYLTLRFADGMVVLRAIGHSWVVVLGTSQANEQLVAMSLTQMVHRVSSALSEREQSTAAPTPRSLSEQLQAVARETLGDHAQQASEILATAGSNPRDLMKAVAEVEKLVRLFISKKKAEEMAARMRTTIGT